MKDYGVWLDSLGIVGLVLQAIMEIIHSSHPATKLEVAAPTLWVVALILRFYGKETK